jgi:HD-GYP domain-containing protein (c-di-GMP phosphodiesterase class II)
MQAVDVSGKGYGILINTDGFIIAHPESKNNGKNLEELYGQDLLGSILNDQDGRITATINDEECTLFVAPVMDQWYSAIIISNSELYEHTWSQLAVNIMVSLITFCLIAFFYYIGYRNEQISSRKVEEMNIQVVSALAAAIDAKDNYTNGHSSRVAEYSRMIAARSGYSKPEQDEIYLMGLLHDVGKIGVPDEVINKPSKLTEEEFDLIKRHPVIGNSILGSIKERPKLATGARWHHERYDGKGYPDGISGEQIPEEARIIAVADAYDAMTSRRSYRDVMPRDKVRSEIEKGIATQFDPRFARIMLQMMDEDTDYSMREK